MVDDRGGVAVNTKGTRCGDSIPVGSGETNIFEISSGLGVLGRAPELNLLYFVIPISQGISYFKIR